MSTIRYNFLHFCEFKLTQIYTIITTIILLIFNQSYIDYVLAESSIRRPHIVFIMADDLGWNDVSFHSSNEIITSNIDALAYNGIIINNLYTQPVCTPSRASFMTGKYPIHLGMQGNAIMAAEPTGLPLDEKTIANYLSNLGYTTRALGKWNLGNYKREFTPRYRGFKSFYGYCNSFTSYYDHITEDTYETGTFCGYDWRRNEEPAWQETLGQYGTGLLTKEAIDIIREHDANESPLFLYIAHLAAHSGNVASMLEAPLEEIEKFRYIMEPNRRTYAAVVSKLDQSVGDIVEALNAKGILKDTIIVFMADNGAPSPSSGSPSLLGAPNWGSNFPFRGTKGTLWQGGVRSASFIWSAELQYNSRVSNHLMHVSDWLPTLYEAAGGNLSDLPSNIDGESQWPIIFSNSPPSSQRPLLVNINERQQNWAVVVGNWKLMVGEWGDARDGHYGTYWDLGDDDREVNYSRSILESKSHHALQNLATSFCCPLAKELDIRMKRSLATIKCDKKLTKTNNPTEQQMEDVQVPSCQYELCLFNLETDPCETENLAAQQQNIVEQMYKLMISYNSTLVPQISQPPDSFSANPRLWNLTWSSWIS